MIAEVGDMLKVSGQYVSPFEVEGALSSHPEVLEAAVIAWPDEDSLIKPKAFVVLKPGVIGDDTLKRTIQNHVKATIAPYKYPRHVEFVVSLPKTDTGKLQRFRLKEASLVEPI